MKYTKPNLSNIWAESGSISVPDNLKISGGWVAEIPPCEEANFIENRQDKALAYLLQMGIVEWDGITEYQTGSFVSYNGNVYRSLGVNTNKQPNVFPANWVVAFDPYGSAGSVNDSLNAVLNAADPFDQYVQKISPRFTVKSSGTSYEAAAGLPLDNLADVGHSFFEDGDTGMFKDGRDIVFAVNAVERGRLRDAPLILEDDSKTLATTEWVRQLVAELTRIKVGDLYLTTNNYVTAAEVATAKGYGIWQRYAEGKALVGFSSDTSSLTPDWYKINGNTNGVDKIAIAVDNLPAHKHGVYTYGNANNVVPVSGNRYPSGTTNTGAALPSNLAPKDNATESSGGGVPLEIVQPSVVISVWKRVA